MDYSIETAPIEKLQCDCIIAGVYTDRQLTPSARSLDEGNQSLISLLLARGDMSGKVGETLFLPILADNRSLRVLLVGLGENKPLTGKNYRKALAAAVNNVKKPYLKSVACTLAECEVEGFDTVWKIRQTLEVFSDACYQYTTTKAEQDNDIKLERLLLAVAAEAANEAQLGLVQGRAIAEGMALTKQLGDLPPNICTPSYLAERAQQIADAYPDLSVKILDETDMKDLGMGSFLAVSRGSRQPAKLIVLTYQPRQTTAKPIVFVGKGLTFDSGGISLKPGLGMDEMKYDMCGGATVLATLMAAAQMQLPLGIIGLVAASENMPDGDANRPGDIVTTLSGKTVEILNTDAEGRLILCDTLTYAERFEPDVVIDMATLTGACLVALGRIPSGLLGNDDALCNELMAASQASYDSVWRLPLWEEYHELLKSPFADLANIGGKDAGTITAACFLSRFTEKFRWAHLDIAGTAWRTGANKGATGRPVPLLCQYLLNRAACT